MQLVIKKHRLVGIEKIINSSSGSLHALFTLVSNGLSHEAFNDVVEANAISRLLYSAPEWWGHATAADCKKTGMVSGWDIYMMEVQRRSVCLRPSTAVEIMCCAASSPVPITNLMPLHPLSAISRIRTSL